MGDPVVSVCIPAFQAERYVREAVESALAQTGPELEVIVFDDASTDGTIAALADLEDPRLRLCRQHTNVGISRNRNSCLKRARGRYLAWLDADDLLQPGALARALTVLDRNPGAGLVHGGHYVIGEDGRRLPNWPAPFDRDTVEPRREAFAELLLSNYVTSSTTVVRRDCYRTLGTYDPALTRNGEDWELWLRIAARHDVAYVAEPLASYRRHGASATAAFAGAGGGVALDRVVVDTALARHPWADRSRAYAALAAKALQAAGRAYAAGSTREATAADVFAVRLFPSLASSRDAWLLAAARLRRDDYACFRHSRALLERVHAHLAGSRFARTLEKLVVPDRAWVDEIAAVADVVRSLVPRSGRVAAVDKHDPTLLHLAGRRGWHVPDLQLLPGYPRNGREAVAHLDALRARGASHFVLPSHAFWWLDQYTELAARLGTYRSVWSDDHCRIYELEVAA